MLAVALAFALHATPAGARDTVAMDACAVAPVEQLRFVIAAGLGHSFPVMHRIDGTMVAIADPGVIGASCSPLTVDVRVSVHVTSGAAVTDSVIGSARIVGEMVARVVYRSAHSKTAASADALVAARLCFRDVSVTALDLPRAPPRVELAQLRAWLDESLRHQDCFDITSLVFVFLQRGGKPPES